jgi:hypothetical protein
MKCYSAFVHSEAIDFGTFGQGMLVNWQYTMPAGRTVTTSINLYDCSDIALHVNPRYSSTVS